LDTLTHALSGALLGRFMARAPSDERQPKVWQMVLAGGLAATFPDLDFVLGYVSELTYLRGHRGVTHSFILLPVWAFLLAWLMPRLLRARSVGWRRFYAVACAGIAIHILGDLITQFGTMILAPFSDRRFGWGTTFIIDLPLTGLLIAGLAASALWRRSRLPAALGLAAVCAWIGVGAVGKSEAIEAARRHAVEQGIAFVSIDAIPRPASPFNWTAVIDDGERYHIAHINTRRTGLLTAEPDDNLIRRFSAHYRPVALAQWEVRERFGNGDLGAVREQVRAVWSAPDFAFFRWFAMFPVLDSVGSAGGGGCVSFRDLRFETPGRDTLPFRYGLCENGGGWALVERTMAGWRALSGR